jgi:hypothetical protein
MGAHRIPPDCAVVPPINALRSTSRTLNPWACPASAAAQPPAPDPRQIQSTVEDHVCAGIGVPSFPSQTVAMEARTSGMGAPRVGAWGLTPACQDAPQRAHAGCGSASVRCAPP